jgi:hypothetical protein
VDPATGTLVVQLDKALYGCVEAAALWYGDLNSKLVALGFVANKHDPCIFNKLDGKVQITVALHVDDLLVTCIDPSKLASFETGLRAFYREVATKRGPVIDYVGMTFDFTLSGQVSITMKNCVDDILASGGAQPSRTSAATSNLFEVRDAPKVSASESAYFHTHVAKILYLAKRIRPDCLTAAAFLSTRVTCCDSDDLSKLYRLLGYLLFTRSRGISLCIGTDLRVRAYIDAAYGVHAASGKSHTGCVIVL